MRLPNRETQKRTHRIFPVRTVKLWEPSNLEATSSLARMVDDAAESEQLAEQQRHAGEARERRLGLEEARDLAAQELTLANTELAAARALEDIFAASVERLAREEQEEKEEVARSKALAAAEAELASAAAAMERRLVEAGTSEQEDNCKEVKPTAEERESEEEAMVRRWRR